MTETRPQHEPIASSAVPFSDRQMADVLESVRTVLETDGLARTTFRERFESSFARLQGVDHAVSVANGSVAIAAVLQALGLVGREILVPANTFIASAAVPALLGCPVRFVDMESRHLAPTWEDVNAALTPSTAAVMIVHMGGVISPSVPTIAEQCRVRGIIVIEDSAHAVGASLGGRRAGQFGDAATFSLYPTKTLVAGEGGVVTTRDPRLAELVKSVRDHGRSADDPATHVRLGSNYRFSELHAIVALAQMNELAERLAARRSHIAAYQDAFRACRVLRPAEWDPQCVPSGYKFWLTAPSTAARDRVKDILEQYGINCPGGIQDDPCHLQPVFRVHHGEASFPNAESFCSRHLCLPVHPGLTAQEIDRVCAAVLKADDELHARQTRDGEARAFTPTSP